MSYCSKSIYEVHYCSIILLRACDLTLPGRYCTPCGHSRVGCSTDPQCLPDIFFYRASLGSALPPLRTLVNVHRRHSSTTFDTFCFLNCKAFFAWYISFRSRKLVENERRARGSSLELTIPERWRGNDTFWTTGCLQYSTKIKRHVFLKSGLLSIMYTMIQALSLADNLPCPLAASIQKELLQQTAEQFRESNFITFWQAETTVSCISFTTYATRFPRHLSPIRAP